MVDTRPPAAEARVGLLQTPIYTSRDLTVLVMPLEVAIPVKQNLTKTDPLPGEAIRGLTRWDASVLEGPTGSTTTPSTLRCTPLLLEGEDPSVRHFRRSHGLTTRFPLAASPFPLDPSGRSAPKGPQFLSADGGVVCFTKARHTPTSARRYSRREVPTSPAPAEDQVSPPQGPSPSPKPTNVAKSFCHWKHPNRPNWRAFTRPQTSTALWVVQHSKSPLLEP
jgi:hypothetical protein